MIKATPKNWLTWNSDVQDNNFFMGNLEFSWRERTGKIITQKSEYRVRYKGLLEVKFFLDNYDIRLGYAQQNNPLYQILDIAYEGQKYQLKSASLFTKKFILLERKKTVGMIYSKNILDRQAIIDLPPTLPLELRLFVTWIVLWFWRRTERNLA